MELLNTLTLLNKTDADRPHATTVGNFDGCHLGHQRLFARTRALASEKGLHSLAVSFSPNPRAFFQKTAAEPALFTNEQKLRAFSELGIDAAFLQSFDEPFSRLSAETFYEEWLIRRFRTRALVVGHDFHFGAQRRGSPQFLRDHTARDGVALHVEPPFKMGETVLSTTAIKAKMRDHGDVAAVIPWLGRPYLVEGIVTRGAQLGRQLGFPTANLAVTEQLLPRNGIYACRAWLVNENEGVPIFTPPRAALPAVISIGTRPTVEKNGGVIVEAHLLEGTFGADGLYGKRLGLYFHHWLRNEERFAGLDELKTAIAGDCARARALLTHSA